MPFRFDGHEDEDGCGGGVAELVVMTLLLGLGSVTKELVAGVLLFIESGTFGTESGALGVKAVADVPDEEVERAAAQLRSYNGGLPSGQPTIPNEGLEFC